MSYYLPVDKESPLVFGLIFFSFLFYLSILFYFFGPFPASLFSSPSFSPANIRNYLPAHAPSLFVGGLGSSLSNWYLRSCEYFHPDSWILL